MAFRSASTNNAQGTSQQVTPPSGIVDGDILLAWAISDNGAGTATFPSGFVHVAGSPINMTSADACTFSVGIKVASGESGNYVITSANAIIAGVACFSGRDPSTTPHQISSVNHDSFTAAGAFTVTSAAFSSNTTVTCDIVMIGAADGMSADSVFSAPSGYTLDLDLNQTDAGPERQGFVAHKDSVPPGETGVLSAGGTNGPAAWSVFAIALAETTAPLNIQDDSYIPIFKAPDPVTVSVW